MSDLRAAMIGGGPALEAAQRVRTFRPGLEAPGCARHFVADALRAWGRTDLLDDANLVVSELATNAVIHAGSTFTVSLTRLGDTLRIGVGDTDRRIPRLRRARGDASHGRGLSVVAAVASDWGCRMLAGGKLVWSDLQPRR